VSRARSAVTSPDAAKKTDSKASSAGQLPAPGANSASDALDFDVAMEDSGRFLANFLLVMFVLSRFISFIFKFFKLFFYKYIRFSGFATSLTICYWFCRSRHGSNRALQAS